MTNAKEGTVLVIDDEEPIREAVQDILDLVGIKVYAAATGEEGLKLFDSHQHEIDVVLLDMQMPTMSGAETCHRLFEIDPTVRIILSSGFSANDAGLLRNDTLCNASAIFFLQKPYAIDSLIDKVREASA